VAFGLAWIEELASVWTGTPRDALHFLRSGSCRLYSLNWILGDALHFPLKAVAVVTTIN